MLAPTEALLAEVFPGSRICGRGYLSWLYGQSPFGSVIEANADDELGRAGHYALVPIELTRDGERLAGALSLNTAVHERARGKGMFTHLAEETYLQARELGVEIVFGIANSNSTHGFLNRLGFTLVTPLPARILVPIPGPRAEVRSAWASDACFERGPIGTDLEPLLQPPREGVARRWTKESLHWRLRDPTARYALHRLPDALLVSCRDQRHGVGVAVLLKLFAGTKLSGRSRSALVRAACLFHRAPLALHVGLNDQVDFRGARLPKRLREQPLNLIYRELVSDERGISLTRFEFLDFDAY